MPLPYNIMDLVVDAPVDPGYDDENDYPFDDEDDVEDEDEW